MVGCGKRKREKKKKKRTKPLWVWAQMGQNVEIFDTTNWYNFFAKFRIVQKIEHRDLEILNITLESKSTPNTSNTLKMQNNPANFVISLIAPN